MQLVLKRSKSVNGATIGELFLDGQHECWILEDEIRERDGVDVSEWKVAGKTAIPAGTYRVVIDFSNRFQKNMIHVINVPGYTGIRIHPGNTPVDTDGCMLPGQSKGIDSVSSSVLATDALQAKVQAELDKPENVYLEVLNP